MLEDRIIYLKGAFVGWDQATVHMMSHSFSRGSAIFEVISFHETANGPAVLRLDENITRLFRTAQLLDMELPISRDELHEAVLNTVKRNALRQGIIKIIGFYPQISFLINVPQKRLDISIFVVDPGQDLGGPLHSNQDTTVCVSKWRKLDPQTVPVEAKAAANYLNGLMANAEAGQRGFDNAIMLDSQGFIAEGGTESIFLVKDGRLMTPILGTILQSITRKSILQAADVIGIDSFEGRLHPELLYETEEMFLSNTGAKVLPIKQIEDRVVEGTPGPITRKLSDLMDKIITGQDERFKNWLFPVE